MQEKEFKELLKKYTAGECSDQEKAHLESWYLDLADEKDPPSHELIDQAFLDVQSKLSGRASRQSLFFPRFASAAAIVIISAAAFYFFRPVQPVSEQSQRVEIGKSAPADAMPGGNRAVLTLSDGSAINLDDVHEGVLAKQAGSGIQKVNQGELLYTSDPSLQNLNQVQYNTISTPRGGQYQVTLPDGTKVWLNAASSLRFPTAFTGTTREVTLTGEAYFEVAENKLMPFQVKVNDSQVEVLGTSFNIMAYPDEVLTTTLLEGSVKFRHRGSEKTIIPGQAAQLIGNIRVREVNTADAVAWKNGVTTFANADIHGIMRQISRWYDLDVVFRGNLPDRKFTGKIPRDARLSQVLKVLELSDINFKIEDKSIIVTP